MEVLDNDAIKKGMSEAWKVWRWLVYFTLAAILACFVARDGDQLVSPEDLYPWFRIALVLMGAGLLIYGFSVRRSCLKVRAGDAKRFEFLNSGDPGLPLSVRRYRYTILVSVGLAQGPEFSGLLYFAFTRDFPILFVAAAISMAGVIYLRPSQSELIDLERRMGRA